MSPITTITVAYASNIICTIFLVLLLGTYIKKKSVKNTETSIYNVLLVFNFVSIIIELLFYISMSAKMHIFIIDVLERIYYISTVSWMYMFTIYNLAIVKKFSKKKIYNLSKEKKRRGIITTLLIITILLSILKITRNSGVEEVMMTSSGAAPSAMFILCVSLLIIDFVTIFKHRNELESKKTLPLYFFLIFILIEMILTISGTQLLLLTLPMTLVSHLMFHTIENPDVKMLEEVSIAKEMAEDANKAKTDFLSSMSHEIRTPLNAIVGFSESLKDEDLPESSKEKVHDIITASNNLLEIVNGILDISKIEANKLELIEREYDIKSTLDELESLTRARIGEKGLELRVNIDPSMPRVLYGDNVRVKQIILNILTNAVKYTKEGYIEFKVSSVIKDNMCRLIISVEDTGIGIKQENISKLFSKFERLDVEKQMTIEGTGLGLAITKKLVDLMGGTIVAQSVYGKGSKFTISIDQKVISVEPIHKEEKVSLVSQIIDVNGARALIVDDNELNIKVATNLLKKYNFNVDSASSGQECIKILLNDDNYDIIFLDDMMPRMSGREVLKKLKNAEDFNIPTIALTANAISGMKEEYLECGFDDYLSKPIEKPELERVINKFIKNVTQVAADEEREVTSIVKLDKEEEKEIEYQDYSGKKVLVVDDSEIDLKLITKTLTNYNFNITQCRSGSECIMKTIEDKYDLILLDEVMPKLNGIDTMDNLKSIENFNIPVILMTNKKAEQAQELIKQNGFKAYLNKPLNKHKTDIILKGILNKKGD